MTIQFVALGTYLKLKNHHRKACITFINEVVLLQSGQRVIKDAVKTLYPVMERGSIQDENEYGNCKH